MQAGIYCKSVATKSMIITYGYTSLKESLNLPNVSLNERIDLKLVSFACLPSYNTNKINS